MRSQVEIMVDAMAAFDNTGSVGAGEASGDTLASNQKVTIHAIAAPAVTVMVDAMKQFDANGQPVLSGASATSGQVATTLNTIIPRKPDTDILASS
jgi:hypothetical protein